MKISVVIPTYFKNSYKEVLKSVIQQEYKDFEIIVVINGGKVKNDRRINNIKIYNIRKSGANNARNFGIKKSSGEIVALIDDDEIAPSNWLSAIENSHKNLRIPVIGGKVLPKWPNNKKPRWVKGILLDYLSIIDTLSNKPVSIGRYEWLSAGNISVQKDIFNKLGYFDEELDRNEYNLLSNGEVELCHRIRNHGYKIMLDPSIVVTHIIKPSKLIPDYFINRAYWQGISDLLMDKKHLENTSILKKFREANLKITYKNISLNKFSDSLIQLCIYSRSIGYLQEYIKNRNL